MYHSFWIHSFADGHLGCFQYLAIVNCAAMNIGAILPKEIYRFNAIPIKVPMTYFTDVEQTFQKFIWDHKWFWIAAAILRKKNKAGGITIPDLNTFTSYNIQNQNWLQDWHVRREEFQWNGWDGSQIAWGREGIGGEQWDHSLECDTVNTPMSCDTHTPTLAHTDLIHRSLVLLLTWWRYFSDL